MKKLLSLLVLAFGLLVASHSSYAANADEGLYDPVAPEGSAFVRMYNNGSDKVDFSTSGKNHGSIEALNLSSYFVQEKGDFDIAAGNVTGKATAEEGKYYTVILKDGKTVVLTDPAIENRAKALVVFYNLTSLPDLSLKTADGKVEVIAPQAAGASASREMNGVKVSFGVFNGIESKASLKESILERGKAYAIVVTQKAEGGVDAQWFESSTNTKK